MDWGMDGSFMSRPKQGWLHAGQQLLPDAGVRYIVKYIGSITVLESMRALDIDTRTAVTNESINRISSSFNPSNTLRKNQKLDRYLGDDVRLCGVQVTLTINTDCLSVVSLETGDLLFQHLMPTISFASGGEPTSQDFVAYVAKSDDGARFSHVFECRSGLARDVITTIGQVFEIRFKTYLLQRSSNSSASHPIPDCVPLPPMPPPQEALHPPLPYSTEAQYYNERSDVNPPSPDPTDPHLPPPPLPPPLHHSHHHAEFDDEIGGSNNNNNNNNNNNINSNGFNNNNNSVCNFCQQHQQHHTQLLTTLCHHHLSNQPDDITTNHISPNHDNFVRRNSDKGNLMCSPSSFSSSHGRSTESFHSAPESTIHPPPLTTSRTNLSPYHEIWFHGRISRPKAEELLHRAGDFLVRESPNSPGQFVLSGRQGASSKHLLLVDPEGKVRTKDQLFSSVSHLVNYHLYNQIPIISNDSQLLLINPIHCTTINN